MATKTSKKQKKVKKQFNMYVAMQKNRKKIVMVICSILIVTMIAGVFAQFALM